MVGCQCNSCRIPWQSRTGYLMVILTGHFLVNSGRICGWVATLWFRNSLPGSNNFTLGHLMKIEWLVANVTAVGSPDRAKRAILGVLLAERFIANSGCICSQGTTLWCRYPLLSPDNFSLGSFSENRVVDNQFNSCRISWQSKMCYFGGDCGWAFLPIQAIYGGGEPLYNVGTPSSALAALFRVI